MAKVIFLFVSPFLNKKRVFDISMFKFFGVIIYELEENDLIKSPFVIEDIKYFSLCLYLIDILLSF